MDVPFQVDSGISARRGTVHGIPRHLYAGIDDDLSSGIFIQDIGNPFKRQPVPCPLRKLRKDLLSLADGNRIYQRMAEGLHRHQRRMPASPYDRNVRCQPADGAGETKAVYNLVARDGTDADQHGSFQLFSDLLFRIYMQPFIQNLHLKGRSPQRRCQSHQRQGKGRIQCGRFISVDQGWIEQHNPPHDDSPLNSRETARLTV